MPDRQVVAARRYAVDLSANLSRVVCAADAQWADMVILMDRANWVRLRKLGFETHRLVWLGSLQPGKIEIDDPYRLSDESAAALMQHMAACVNSLASALREPAA